jgi:hypothetical protein
MLFSASGNYVNWIGMRSFCVCVCVCVCVFFFLGGGGERSKEEKSSKINITFR